MRLNESGHDHKKLQIGTNRFVAAKYALLYADMRFNVLIVMMINTKRKNKTQKNMRLFCHLIKSKKKAARVKMRMIENAN